MLEHSRSSCEEIKRASALIALLQHEDLKGHYRREIEQLFHFPATAPTKEDPHNSLQDAVLESRSRKGQSRAVPRPAMFEVAWDFRSHLVSDVIEQSLLVRDVDIRAIR